MHRASRRSVSLVPFLLAAAALVLGAAPAFAQSPTLSVPGAQTVTELQPLSFTVTATDPRGLQCVLTASNLPGSAVFTDNGNNTGSFSWTPGASSAGDYVVYFTADNTFGGVTTASVDITVTNADSPPVLSPIADRTLDPGTMVFVSVSGSDPDLDPLTLSASGLPSFGSLTDNGDGTGTITLAPSGTQAAGTWPVTVNLSDGTSTVSQSFNVTITAPAGTNPPVLSPIGDQTVAEGTTANVPVTATDPDGGTLTFTSSLPGFAALVGGTSSNGSASATLSMSPGYCASGTYPATISVSDGSLSDAETFSITVTDVSRPPVWASYGYTVTLAEGASATLDVAAPDPDQACGAHAAILTLAGSTAGSALTLGFVDHGDGTGRLSITAAAASAGSYQVTLRATDYVNSTLVVQTVVAVTVTHVDHAPTANPGGPYAGVAGGVVPMDGSASSDPDGDALTYAWTFGDGGTADGMSPSHSYAAAGSYTVTLTVSDGTLSGQASTTATVVVASQPIQAKAWCEPPMIRLWKGSPWVHVRLVALQNSFDPSDVVLASLALGSPSVETNSATVGPTLDRTMVVTDPETGASEVRADFARDAVRNLLSFVKKNTYMTLTLTAQLRSGATVEASFTALVVPGKACAIRRVGPNPLNPEAVVTLVVPAAGHVRLRVFDLRGRYVRTLYDGDGQAGQTLNLTFDGHDDSGRPLASGQYYLKAETAAGVDTSPVTILK